MRPLVTAFALLACSALPAAPAAAHAILLDSTPAVNATIAGPSVSVSLRYNTRIDQTRSRLTLTKPDHSMEILPIAATDHTDLLQATVDLTPGTYSLRWQVLAVDGHITRGDVPFTVGGN
jgi:copper resistance protein C